MIEVYYYVRTENVPNILDCGLKLSTSHNREAIIGGEKSLCFSGLLNPKDNMELYRSKEFTCLKVQVKREKCFVADRFLFENAADGDMDMELYYGSIIPVEEYIFGTYRLPECLITSTILAGEASVLDKRMDSPVIYTYSEELYINNILQELREQLAETDDFLLYYYFDKLVETNRLEKIENLQKGTAVFRTENGKTYCIKKPELSRFYDIERISWND